MNSIDELFDKEYDECVQLFTRPSPFGSSNRHPLLRLTLILTLVIALPLLVWAVATQRIELRKKAATSEPPVTCWNRVTTFNGAYHWPDSCKGSPRTDTMCSQILIPLTPEETNEYDRWVALGRPYVPGCEMPTPTPTPIPPGCYYQQVQCIQAPCNPILVCPTPTACSPEGSECTISSCPPCPPGQACPMKACPAPPLGVCQNRHCVPMPTPTPTPYLYCSGPNGSSCTITECPVPAPCPPGTACPMQRMPCYISQGNCQNHRCIQYTPTPTPTPYIHVLSPNGGEQLTVGQTYTIRWQSSPGIATYLIYLVNSQRQESLINGISAPNTSLTWTVNSPIMLNTQQHKIKVMDGSSGGVGTATQDLSDNFFIISNPTPTSTPTPTPSPTPAPQTLRFRVKLAGVTGGEAEGATIGVKFYTRDGTILQLSSPLTLTHVSGGMYDATAVLTNPFPSGTAFTMRIKGEKHVAVKFCKQVGQTGPCADSDFITVPNPVPLSYGFDLTGIPLPPGDVPPQDLRVDRTDIDRVKALMSKLCSQLTDEEKKTGDLDYNGCVNVRDIFLLRQTLETRYDE